MTQEETEKYFDFERKKHFDFFLPYYQEQNWQLLKDNIDRDTPIDWDVRLNVSAGEYVLVDEKAREGDYGDCLIELIQDLKTMSWGWFFGKKDWVLYGSWENPESNYPSSLYLIDMEKLRRYIYSLKGILQTVISHKGSGITWNITWKWEELISKGIAIKLI